MKWGDFDLEIVSGGRLWLDGGAMFGVVPKALWRRRTACDEHNRIPLDTNCLLVRTPDKTVLIDTGSGSKFDEKHRQIYRLEAPDALLQNLEAAGVGPEDVDVVINTHLHFDHAGGNTRLVDDRPEPTFPRAEYIVRGAELQAAENVNERNSASYEPADWRPLQEAGCLRVVDGDDEVELLPGIRFLPTPGHTPGHQSVILESGGQGLLFLADLCPTQAHVPLPWIMAYDLHPMTTLETRRRVYPRALSEGWTLVFEHDSERPTGVLVERSGRYSVEPVSLF